MFYLNSQIDWLDTFFFYTVPDQSVDFRVLDSCRAMVISGNFINVDFTEDTIEND
jgi:hypothetical protein